MVWVLSIVGIVFSMLVMLLVARKWKLSLLPSLVGAIISAFVAVLPFLWIYPRCKTDWEMAVAVFTQIGLSHAIATVLLMQRFWRDPERVPPETGGVVLSVADGKVVYVWNIAEDSAIVVSKGGRNYRLDELTGIKLATNAVRVVGVGMSFLDVHVNRCPISGQVKLTKHVAGRFISLGRDEAPFVNERLTTVIENDSLNVAVVQIASRLVRRIQSYLKVGETVSAGQRLGMIRFGSLVAVVLPQREDIEMRVKPGDRVTAGQTILARFREDAYRGDE